MEQFDVVVGNPPWNKIKADIKEFYGHYDPIVFGMQGARLKQYVEAELLLKKDLQLAWQKHRKHVQSYTHLLLSSAMYNHQGIRVGKRLIGSDPDFYKFFLERSLQIVRPGVNTSCL